MERRIPIRRHRLCRRVHDRASWRGRHESPVIAGPVLLCFAVAADRNPPFHMGYDGAEMGVMLRG